MWKRQPGALPAVAFVAGCLAAPLAAQDDGLAWLGDYREAIKQAKETNKPIFLEFRCEP
jgi:hypothetical protein